MQSAFLAIPLPTTEGLWALHFYGMLENIPNLWREWRRFVGSDIWSHQFALAIMADGGKAFTK